LWNVVTRSTARTFTAIEHVTHPAGVVAVTINADTIVNKMARLPLGVEEGPYG